MIKKKLQNGRKGSLNHIRTTFKIKHSYQCYFHELIAVGRGERAPGTKTVDKNSILSWVKPKTRKFSILFTASLLDSKH